MVGSHAPATRALSTVDVLRFLHPAGRIPSMKPKVNFLLPLWDQSSVARFGRLGLPSLVSPGNLPALAAATELTLCLLASRDGLTAFDALPASEALRQIGAVQTVSIDDLALDFPFALLPTLAFLRGIGEANAPTDTHFIFWDPDLVVADGGLASVGRRILESHSVLLTSSVLTDAEALTTRLMSPCSNSRPALQIPPRQLVRTALSSLHPLQIGAIVNGNLPLWSRSGNLWWRVDDDTLIGRHFLPTLLCLKPERLVDRVSAFFDISFVPKMCSSAKPFVLTDSDEFFAVRMRARDVGQEDLRFGRPSLSDTARDMSTWVTEAHCAHALAHTHTIHVGDLPPLAERIAARAKQHVEQLVSLLLPAAQHHDNHPHWLVSEYLWALRRFELHGGTPPKSPFMPGTEADQVGRLRGAWGRTQRRVRPVRGFAQLRRRVRDLAFGRPPFVRSWHPDWLDYRPLAEVLRSLFGHRNLACLHIAEDSGVFSELAGAPSVTPTEILSSHDDFPNLLAKPADVALLELEEQHLPGLPTLIERIRPRVRSGGKIVAYYKERGASTTDIAPRIARMLLAMPLSTAATVTFAGGEEKRWLRQEFSVIPSYLRRWKLLRGALILSKLLVKTARSNRRLARVQDERTNVSPWSSFVMTLGV